MSRTKQMNRIKRFALCHLLSVLYIYCIFWWSVFIRNALTLRLSMLIIRFTVHFVLCSATNQHEQRIPIRIQLHWDDIDESNGIEQYIHTDSSTNPDRYSARLQRAITIHWNRMCCPAHSHHWASAQYHYLLRFIPSYHSLPGAGSGNSGQIA